MSKPEWTINGVPFPRNPDDFNVQWDKATVTYEPQSDGSQVRVAAPFLLRGGDVTLSWDFADRKTYGLVSQILNQVATAPGTTKPLVMGNLQPPTQLNVYPDTWATRKYSKDVFTYDVGQGNVRTDLSITMRTDAYMRSVFAVPELASPDPAVIKQYFGGYIGNGTDFVPVWNPTLFPSWFQAVTMGSAAYYFANLGTAYWNPKIRFVGPFASGMNFISKTVDVDNTGLGIIFTYLGPALGNEDYLIVDTLKRRCYLSQDGSAENEIYSFTLVLVSSGIPFPYFPGWPPTYDNQHQTVQNSIIVNMASYGAGSAVDFSNQGTNQFFYW